MLEIKTFNFGPFGTNTYVVSYEDKNALIIDPACSNEYEQQVLYRYIQLEALQVQSIIATHGHLDHLWGAKWAAEKWNTPILMHEADIPMAKAMQQQYELFGIRATAEEFPIEPITNDQLPINNLSIIPTPGHTPGSICIYFPQSPITKNEVNRALAAENNQSPILISGDTLFRMGYGRTDLPGGNMGQLIDSLSTLFALPEDVLVYPGHGEPTTIGAERR